MNSYFREDAETELALTNLDNVNLLYVSFTRPEERLYINVPYAYQSSIAEIIHEVAVENFRPDEDDPLSYSLGTRKKKSELNKDDGKKKSKPEHVETGSVVSSAWYKKIVIKSSYRKLKVFDEKFGTVKTNKGIVVHKLLSYLKYAGDSAGAVNQALFEGVISESEKYSFKELLDGILSNPEISDWYDTKWTVMNETEILTKEGRIARPDRVITQGDETVIIDYKTGKERDEDIEQLNDYEVLLRDMGYKNVRKYLLHISDSENDLIKVKQV
jgi:ATP-dependent exoDNAse (exonuclease V) beta subunit